MEEAILSGQASFKIEVPYKLFEVGKSEQKPLIVYLHGFRQNMETFRAKIQSMLSIDAYHLFVQGPYPLYDRDRQKKVEEWGRAWYLYDGNQSQFIDSLEHTSRFLEEIIENIGQNIPISRTAVVGYSMGGYLAGYFGLSRCRLIDELVVVGSRIKTEVFEDRRENYDNLNVLALHGKHDRSVQSRPQKQSCTTLLEWGAEVTFRELDEGHKLTEKYLKNVKDWLLKLGY